MFKHALLRKYCSSNYARAHTDCAQVFNRSSPRFTRTSPRTSAQRSNKWFRVLFIKPTLSPKSTPKLKQLLPTASQAYRSSRVAPSIAWPSSSRNLLIEHGSLETRPQQSPQMLLEKHGSRTWPRGCLIHVGTMYNYMAKNYSEFRQTPFGTLTRPKGGGTTSYLWRELCDSSKKGQTKHCGAYIEARFFNLHVLSQCSLQTC